MFDMWARERAEVPLPEPYVRDYFIWFICVFVVRREEFCRSLLGLCGSAGESKLYRHCSTTKAFIYYALTLTGTQPHILAPTNFTSQPLAPLVSFHKSAETGSQLGCENHKKWSRASAPHFFFLNLIFSPAFQQTARTMQPLHYCLQRLRQAPITKLSFPVAIVCSYSYLSTLFFLPHA